MCTHRGALVELVGAPLAADATASVPSPCQWGGACPVVNIFHCTPVNISRRPPVNISKCEHIWKWTSQDVNISSCPLVNISTYPCECLVYSLWQILNRISFLALIMWTSQFFPNGKSSDHLQPSCERLRLKCYCWDLYFAEPHNPVRRWWTSCSEVAHVKFLLVWHILRRTSQTSASLHGEHLNQVKSAKWCSSNMGHILPMWMFYCDTACYEHLNQVKICPI